MPYQAAARIYQQSTRITARALASISLLVGAAILIGGPDRFNYSPAFATAATVPGGWVTWGILDAVVGTWTLIASHNWHRREVMWGLLAQTVLFSFWTVTIGYASVMQPRSPFTGVAVYGGYTVACSICYVAGHELRKVEPLP